MFTGLVAGLMGLVTSLMPEILKEVRDTRNHTRELEHLRLQNEMQLARAKVEAEAKMREADASVDLEHLKTLGQMIENTTKPIGIPWIDGLNAIIRPATAALMLVLFLWTSCIFISGVMAAYGSGRIQDEMQLATVIWGSMIGEAFQGVFGYLFVARGCRKVMTK